MCGIAGIIDFRGREIPRDALERFRRVLRRRGPDDSGLFLRHAGGFSVGLAHTRLAVIDPTSAGHQPMTDPEARHVLVYNGELYNFENLRAELPGQTRSRCDTEVVLRACIAWGPEALHRFDAMWAMAFVDLHERRGHLSRDPFGIKPLYYVSHDDRLIFASELTALHGVEGLPLEVDPDAVACCLNLGYIPHPRTIYRNVCKLPPGHLLAFDRRGPATPERFFHLPEPADPPPAYEDARRQVRERVAGAVVRQRVADVPVGAFLSGGLDSSVVVASLARAGGRVRTFSIGYPDHPAYDESAVARRVARHLGTDHQDCPLTFADVLGAVRPMLDHLGEPFADSSLLPTSLVSGHTREHVTVALSGDGGDELFGGYWRYLGHHYLERYRRWPSPVRRGLIEPLLRRAPVGRSSRWLNRLRQARKLLRGDTDDFMDRHIAWARLLDDDRAPALLGDEAARRTAGDIRRLYHEAASSWRPTGSAPSPERDDGLAAILLADLAVGLPGDMLHKVDLASMYHSLEVRVPLLDAGLVGYVTGLPVHYRVEGTRTKRILRDAFRDLLPDEVLSRPKMGFEVPVGEFLRDGLRDMYHDVVTPEALRALALNPDAAARLDEEHRARRADHADVLWALLALCYWHAHRPAPRDCLTSP